MFFIGEKHQVTGLAMKLFEMAESKLREEESKVSELEKQINPLLDENDKVPNSKLLNFFYWKALVNKTHFCTEAASVHSHANY